ncbi:MAG: SAM-dependent methyltransferase [Desulfobulbus propionicus]|nr:MAG: SAM-dependent methyltransferase [Desulfobulbus propionicus]
MKNTLSYHSLDWNQLWQKAREDKKNRFSDEEAWDKRAPGFARRTATSVYTKKFIELLQPQQQWTVLDVGSGPGTIAVPLASHVTRITCIDFSQNMLNILEQRKKEHNLDNISTCKASWADQWQEKGIPQHDVVIASRSLGVDNLLRALEKLNSFARKQVIVTDRVHHGPRDPEAYRAVSRPLSTGPDYIYTVNLLYQMGFAASVEMIRLDEKHLYASQDEVMESYLWMLPDLDDKEKKQLKKYIQSITTIDQDSKIHVHRRYTPRWAFIRWDPADNFRKGKR